MKKRKLSFDVNEMLIKLAWFLSHKLVETYAEERRAENASAKKVREDLAKN